MIGYKPIEYSFGRMTAKKNMTNLGEFWVSFGCLPLFKVPILHIQCI